MNLEMWEKKKFVVLVQNLVQPCRSYMNILENKYKKEMRNTRRKNTSRIEKLILMWRTWFWCT